MGHGAGFYESMFVGVNVTIYGCGTPNVTINRLNAFSLEFFSFRICIGDLPDGLYCSCVSFVTFFSLAEKICVYVNSFYCIAVEEFNLYMPNWDVSWMTGTESMPWTMLDRRAESVPL